MSSFEMWRGSSADLSLVSRLSHCAGFMANWGRNFLQKFEINLKTVRCRLSSSDLLLMKVKLLNFFNEKRRLAKLLEDEELYWKQWAKAFWLENGDLNSNFFSCTSFGS